MWTLLFFSVFSLNLLLRDSAELLLDWHKAKLDHFFAFAVLLPFYLEKYAIFGQCYFLNQAVSFTWSTFVDNCSHCALHHFCARFFFFFCLAFSPEKKLNTSFSSLAACVAVYTNNMFCLLGAGHLGMRVQWFLLIVVQGASEWDLKRHQGACKDVGGVCRDLSAVLLIQTSLSLPG